MRIHTMTGDGNCFYRAIALAYYNDECMHAALRYVTMNHIQTHLDEYKRYFDEDINLLRYIHANKRSGVWNKDIAELVPYIVSTCLNVCILIHNQDAYGHIDTSTFGYAHAANGNVIHILRTNNSHHNLII